MLDEEWTMPGDKNSPVIKSKYSAKEIKAAYARAKAEFTTDDLYECLTFKEASPSPARSH